jgi:hypothetical protein
VLKPISVILRPISATSVLLDQKKQEKQEEDYSNKGFITYFLEKVFGIK